MDIRTSVGQSHVRDRFVVHVDHEDGRRISYPFMEEHRAKAWAQYISRCSHDVVATTIKTHGQALTIEGSHLLN